MPRIKKYGKAHAVRFKKDVEKKLLQVCIQKEVNKSDIIQNAVECYLFNKKCFAKRRSL